MVQTAVSTAAQERRRPQAQYQGRGGTARQAKGSFKAARPATYTGLAPLPPPPLLLPLLRSAPLSLQPRTHSLGASLAERDGTLWCASVCALTCARRRWNTRFPCSSGGASTCRWGGEAVSAWRAVGGVFGDGGTPVRVCQAAGRWGCWAACCLPARTGPAAATGSRHQASQTAGRRPQAARWRGRLQHPALRACPVSHLNMSGFSWSSTASSSATWGHAGAGRKGRRRWQTRGPLRFLPCTGAPAGQATASPAAPPGRPAAPAARAPPTCPATGCSVGAARRGSTAHRRAAGARRRGAVCARQLAATAAGLTISRSSSRKPRCRLRYSMRLIACAAG